MRATMNPSPTFVALAELAARDIERDALAKVEASLRMRLQSYGKADYATRRIPLRLVQRIDPIAESYVALIAPEPDAVPELGKADVRVSLRGDSSGSRWSMEWVKLSALERAAS